MWGDVYVAEKLAQFREERLEGESSRRRDLFEGHSSRHLLADKLGKALIRWGTRLREWSATAGGETRLAAAEGRPIPPR